MPQKTREVVAVSKGAWDTNGSINDQCSLLPCQFTRWTMHHGDVLRSVVVL